MNQGGHLFLRQAKGNNLNLRKTWGRISEITVRVNGTDARAKIHPRLGSAIRVKYLFGILAKLLWSSTVGGVFVLLGCVIGPENQLRTATPPTNRSGKDVQF